jgi:hypothetical protein
MHCEWLNGGEEQFVKLMAAINSIADLDPAPDLAQAVIHGIRNGTPATEMLVQQRSFFGLLLNEAATPEAAEEDVVEEAAPDQASPPEAEDDAVVAIYRASESHYYDSPLEDLQSFIVKYKKEDFREI